MTPVPTFTCCHTRTFRRYAPAILLVATITACSGGEAASPSPAPAEAAVASGSSTPGAIDPARQFAVWHDDFPFKVHLSPLVSGQWYGFSSHQALERLVERLAGTSTREGWVMAKWFFEHAPEEAVPLLLSALDRDMQARDLADHYENVTEALGRLGHLGPRQDVSEALLRALQYPRESVQIKAMQSLAAVGTADAMRTAAQMLDGLPLRARAEWIRGVRKHLPSDEVVATFREMLTSDRFERLFGIVIQETVHLPVEQAVAVLGPMWDDARGPLRLTIASVLHAAGDLRGTAYVRDELHDADPKVRALAVQAAKGGSLDKLRDDVLTLTTDPDPEVRRAALVAISDLPGENIDNVLVTMSVDESIAVRQAALKALQLRGYDEPLDQLVHDAETGTGTKMMAALADLIAAGDPRVVPLIDRRLAQTPPNEQRELLRTLGRSGMPEAFTVLKRVFLQPEYRVTSDDDDTNVTLLGVVFPNLSEARDSLVKLYDELPQKDYRRRATMMFALGNMASLSEDTEFRDAVYGRMRKVAFSPEEIPQMRLLALEYLRRDLRLSDMVEVRKLQESTEDQAMRKALTSFLFEFF